ncbi:conserved hypothetical protein [Histoplasma capsulatum H143]|uniref:RNA polymerase I-specific transcription initiation factor RRN6-like protein n=1 Tax=Ajellomyces capsulatus (strain H143) TaxID=544712 RepID=C6HQ70_AJECH|nr:conserved hypothetical protein [Histoplasma capsulatum H143]
MGDYRTNILQYGHLGTATYLPDLQVWEFSRKIDRVPSLVLYGHVNCAFAAPEPSGAWSLIHNSSGLLTNKDEDDLLKIRPELAPALDLFRRHEASSRAITAAVTKFDPQVSNLLAVGNAINFDRRGGYDSTVPIAALISSDSTVSIQLVELEDEEIAWPPDSDRLAKIPTFQTRRRARWMGTAGPVQQICFAETVDEKSTWLAVRFIQSTIVFRPQRNKLSLSAHYDDMDFMRENLADTRLDANPILSISVSATGGVPHAGITFNPWYQQQIAIVDRLGNWTVWDIGKQRHSTYWCADRGQSGRLYPEETPHSDESFQRDHYDGWAAILWVGNVHKLLVCDRRNIALYRIDTDPVQRHTIDVDIQRESEWILDIKRSQSNLSNIFVLTTTQPIPDSSIADPTNDGKVLNLVKFIGQRSNLEVIEALYVARADGGDETYEPFSSTPRLKTEKSAKRVVDDDDDFIVDDLNEVVLPLSAGRRNWNANIENTWGQPIRAFPYVENWVDIYGLASAAVTEQIGSRGKSTISDRKTQTFYHWLDDLNSNFGELVLGDSPLSSNCRTMLDIVPAPPFLDDIDRNTRDFDQFLARLADPMQNMLPTGYEITHIPISYSSSSNVAIPDHVSSRTTPANITSLYDSLVRDWLFPLPGDFPNKIRMAKEKIIRNIVMQLVLSRMVLIRRLSSEIDDPESGRNPETAEGEFSRFHLHSSILWSNQEPIIHSQKPTITITPSAGQTELDTASFFLPSSQPTATSTATTTTPYATLRLYTSLKQPNQPHIPRRIAEILSHWKPGTDPSAYNWQAAVRTLHDEKQLQTENQATSRRRRRHEARKLRRYQQQLSQQPYLQSLSVSTPSVPTPSASQVPVPRMGHSQQQQPQSSRVKGQGSFLGTGTGISAVPQMMVQSSQLTEEGDVPMTQVERGLFGGRNAASKKAVKERKKKRAAGF